MKSKELMDELFSLAIEREYSEFGDVCKAGDPQKEIKKVAVAMFPTVDVIKEVKNWGADLLIVHEPLFYNGKEDVEDNLVYLEKKKLIDECDFTIYRFHDHPHYTYPDIIAAGEFKKIGLKGNLEITDVFDLVRFRLEEPLTALELAKLIEEKLNIKHIRICGARNIKSTVISSVFGSGGVVAFDELKKEESQIVLVGETCEWAYAEYARDAAQLGINKSLLILGHVGSERDGMEYTKEIIKEKHPELDVKYFECDEVYTYTD